ncbi:Glycolate dehydrogenase, iron-sulfur subunit GlcF [hydrothermal vent metagenome]|uniref:Glycolate dehydrogenase, iron-sulfur subunit GlcF n=1 Tax=hydrothermal vent metagenome TaxID=652676 RepID=A0A3B1B0A9_9ZZZZ
MNSNENILQLADRCVKCGLCLPQCPTYQLSRNENESPRGRIALIQALANQQLTADDDSLYQHLDNCLLCRRCERICPSGVKYACIMDLAQEKIHQARPPSRTNKFSQKLLSRYMQSTYQALYLYQKSGVQKLVKPLLKSHKKLSWLHSLLPALPSAQKFKSHYSTNTNTAGHLAIFTGCTGKNIDTLTLDAAIRLLNALGYKVSLPPAQNCCGALQQHRGQTEETQQLAENNLHAFADENYDAVLFLASGCGAQLMEYPQRNWNNHERQKKAAQLQEKLQDISGFLARALKKKPLAFTALDKQVVVHQPCSQRNILKLPDTASQLLAQIPGIQLSALAEDTPCCGAAGDYMLRHPQQAQTLRQHLLDKILADKVEIIVSTNIGCSLFIQTGLKDKNIRVIHPVQLLAEQLNESRDKI